MMNRSFFLLGFILLLFTACQQEPKLFTRISPGESNIYFSNNIQASDSFNILTFEYIYNGGGVGVGDFNLDGYPDLYFTGNQVSGRLYLNNGDFTFTDITEKSGTGTDRWVTGVAVADVNDDGFPDLYLGVSGSEDPELRSNLLFVNQGDLTFKEQAHQYGLADTSYTNHAAFFDYDLDGDLDLYLLNTTNDGLWRNVVREKFVNGEASSTDKLYRNQGDGTFADVSRQAGILVEGFGLGLAITDFNQDHYPDIYVSNDYLSNDLLYINNQDGTFTEDISNYFRHQSNFAMGNDVADLNNDGREDVITLDMLPAGHYREKMMSGAMNYDKFLYTLENGYDPQYMRNTVQLNNGNGSFSEIGCLLGVHKTDWSWSPLLADFDNDGDRDLAITNGYRKDITDMDFIVYRQQIRSQEQLDQAIDSLPGARIRNFIFENKGGLQFADQSLNWGFENTSFSNGAAFADLDRDGDLDYIVSNIDEPPFIFRNNAEKIYRNNWLKIRLEGPPGNLNGFGAEVRITAGNQLQVEEFHPVRGFQSSVEQLVHFGLGKADTIQLLEVQWPDGKINRLEKLTVNQQLEIKYKDAVAGQKQTPDISGPKQLFTNKNLKDSGISYRHREDQFIDFKYEPLLPHQFSQQGPALAGGDINGDNLDDFYVGGAKDQPGYFMISNNDGTFSEIKFASPDSLHEDVDALFFDADQDQDLDLYIVSGGNEKEPGHMYYQDRLYINDGSGNFVRDSNALPEWFESGSCVEGADYDHDGDLDLFVGSRVTPRSYPKAPASVLLINQDGRFSNQVARLAPGLEKLGMITDALWSDYNQDGLPDLLVVGEWLPVTIFKNSGAGKLEMQTELPGLAGSNGWWRTIAGADFDGDGDQDYILGNLGLNSDLKATTETPLQVFAHDFDQNGTLDAILAEYQECELFPVPPRDAILDQISRFRMSVPNYSDYAKKNISQLFDPTALKKASNLKAYNLASSYLENLGENNFKISALPVDAQLAPVNDIEIRDFDGDNQLDLLMVGNDYSAEILTGWYDAFNGLFLKGDGKGNFQPQGVTKSGFKIDKVGRKLIVLEEGRKHPSIVVAQNNAGLRMFKLDQNEKTEGASGYSAFSADNRSTKK